MSITAQCILNLNVFILFYRYETNLAEIQQLYSTKLHFPSFTVNFKEIWFTFIKCEKIYEFFTLLSLKLNYL